MEHLANLTGQQRLKLEEAYATKYAVERDAEREEDAKRSRERKKRGGGHTSRDTNLGATPASPPTPVHSLTHSLSGTTIHQDQQPTHQATAFRTGTFRVQQSDKPAVFDGVFRLGGCRQQKVLVFQAHMATFLRQEDCLHVVETEVHSTGKG